MFSDTYDNSNEPRVAESIPFITQEVAIVSVLTKSLVENQLK